MSKVIAPNKRNAGEGDCGALPEAKAKSLFRPALYALALVSKALSERNLVLAQEEEGSNGGL